tara:strand:+ start:303 stop:560 length:258 start_codon:yes stop_codon:yes gene_type:complete
MKVELTDEEVTTILVALDNYGEAKRVEWLESRADPDAPDMGDEELLDESGSAEWCWQKIMTAQETQTNNQTSAPVDPFSLPGEEK